MSRPEGARRLIASGFKRGGGARASWRAYELDDGRIWISVNGKCVDEEDRLSDSEAISRAEALALEALKAPPA